MQPIDMTGIPDEARTPHPGPDSRLPTPLTDLVCRRIRVMTGDNYAICEEVPNRLAYHARRMEQMAYQAHARTFLVGIALGVFAALMVALAFRSA